MVLLEHVFDAMRVIDQVAGPGKETHPGNITVLLRHRQGKAQGVTLGTPRQGMPMWAQR